MRVLGVVEAVQQRKTFQVLKWVGLQHRMNAFPEELSGGEQQRVAIARALVNDPQLVLADEPTGNLDPDLSFEIMNLFREINARGTTVVVATHDRELIRRVGRRVGDARSRPRRGGGVMRGAAILVRRSAGQLVTRAAVGAAVDRHDRARAVRPRRIPHRHRQSRAARRRMEQHGGDVGLPRGCRSPTSSGEAIESALAASDIVASREYVSKDAALTRFKETFKDSRTRSRRSATNPLPASYEVRLKAGSGGGGGHRRARREAPRDGRRRRRAIRPAVAEPTDDRDRRHSRRRPDPRRSADDRRRADRRLGRAAGAARAARRNRDHAARRRAAGVRSRPVRHGRRRFRAASARWSRLSPWRLPFSRLRGRFLVPLAAAVNLSSITFLPVELAVLLVVGGMAVGCVGGLVAAWGRLISRFAS